MSIRSPAMNRCRASRKARVASGCASIRTERALGTSTVPWLPSRAAREGRSGGDHDWIVAARIGEAATHRDVMRTLLPGRRRRGRAPSRRGAAMTITTTDESILDEAGEAVVPYLVGDFYHFQDFLTPQERESAARVREYFETEVRPVANDYWERAEFPKQIIPDSPSSAARLVHPRGAAASRTRGVPRLGGARAGAASTLGRAPSSACRTAWRWAPRRRRLGRAARGVAAEDRERRGGRRLRPHRADSGSDSARGLRTTARREGDNWVLNGAKRWIGNATFADIVVIWAKDAADGQVKGFLVDTRPPGLHRDEDRGQARAPQRAERRHHARGRARARSRPRCQNATASRTPPTCCG